MCLFPRRIRNPAYDSLVDCQKRSVFADSSFTCIPSDYEVDVPCGKCWQCLRMSRFDTVLRLKVELSVVPAGSRSYFVTLTFDDFNLSRFQLDYLRPVRLWVDRLRKRYGSFRYWFVSELGESNLRLHFHGVLFGLPDISYSELCASWTYGISWFGTVTNATCGYITKYITKQQIDPSYDYTPYKLSSKSFGSGFDGLGVDFVRRHVSYVDPSKASPTDLPNCIVFPGDPCYVYVLSRYYMLKLYTKEQLQGVRWISYSSGFHFRFRGVSYSSRDEWRSAIRCFALTLSPDLRIRFIKDSILPRAASIPGLVRFNYLLTSYNKFYGFSI